MADKTPDQLIREGLDARSAREGCLACGVYHGSVTVQIACLERALWARMTPGAQAAWRMRTGKAAP
jgi:hypothetical protein